MIFLFIVCTLNLFFTFLVLLTQRPSKEEHQGLFNLRHLSRQSKIIHLKTYYCETMSEDPINGSMFDFAVLDAIEKVNTCQSQT